MARYGKKAATQVAQALHEQKRGALKIGRSTRTVKSRKQAIAIGLAEARRAGGKVPKKPAGAKRSASATKKRPAARKAAARRG